MRRVLPFYLTIELLCLLLYGWFAWTWVDWKSLGANAFPGSPDAGWLYGRAYQHYVWAGGLIIDIAIGGVATAFILQVSLSGRVAIRTRLLQLAVFVLPVAALVSGRFIESSIPWPEVEAGIPQ